MTTCPQALPRDGSFILAVDDDPTNLKVIRKCLDSYYTVCAASNAEQALEILSRRVPALVILDVMMPELSGIDVCMIMKTSERLSEVPVIFLSSCDKPDDFKTGHNAGAVMYVTKPIRPAQLLQMVGLFASRVARKE